jgi:hypothetical protein
MHRCRHAGWFTALALFFCCGHGKAQSPVAAPPPPDVTHSDLPPSAIYAETLAPFDQTRSDLGNWSEIELAAFQTATVTADAECKRLEQSPHEGEEALALARLCSVGMNWDGTYSAARWYTRRGAPASEAIHLATGFGLLLQADLNLQTIARAIGELEELHDRLPLNADTDSIFRYTVDALEVLQPDNALKAALLRQPGLLEVVAGKGSSVPPVLPVGVAEDEAWHTLALLHMARRTEEEEQARAQLLDAIAQRTGVPSTMDLYLAQRGRRRYEWLDKAMPAIDASRSTYPAARLKPVPGGTELFVIEREDAADVPALALAVDALRTRLPRDGHAALLLQPGATATTKQPATTKLPPTAKQPASATTVHAIHTTDDLLELFGFSNGPLFVIRDSQLRVKYLGTGTAAWLNPQRQAERPLNANLP